MPIESGAPPIVCPCCRARQPAGALTCDYCGAALPRRLPAWQKRLIGQDDLLLGAGATVGLALLLCVLIGWGSLSNWLTYRSNQANYARLLQEETAVSARILAEWNVRYRGGVGCKLTYQFPAQVQGQTIHMNITQGGSRATCARVQPGDVVPARYAASDPTLAVLESDFAPPTYCLFLLGQGVFLALGLLGLGIAGYGGLKLYRLRQLERRGHLAEAEILRVWTTNSYRGGRSYSVRFRFCAPGPDGRETTITQERSHFYALPLKAGQIAWVCYLPENPAICELANG